MVTSIFPLPTKRLIAAGVIYVPPGLALAQNAAVLNTFVRTIHQKQCGKKRDPPTRYGDISIKDEARLLKWHKAILSRRSETKSNSFRRPAHKGNKWAYSPTASSDWRDVFVSGERSSHESFQLPEETLMKEFWVMEEPWRSIAPFAAVESDSSMCRADGIIEPL